MTSEPDLEKSKAATFEGLLGLFADHLQAASFEELLADPEWRYLLASRHEPDHEGAPLGPGFLPTLADDAFEISLGLAEVVVSARAERPELFELLENAVELAYSVGRKMAIVELTDGDPSLLALAQGERTLRSGLSRGGQVRRDQLHWRYKRLRKHWAGVAHEIYERELSPTRPWTLSLLASRVHVEGPVCPYPDDWDDFTPKDQEAWVKRRDWGSDQIAAELRIAVEESPGVWSFERLINVLPASR